MEYNVFYPIACLLQFLGHVRLHPVPIVPLNVMRTEGFKSSVHASHYGISSDVVSQLDGTSSPTFSKSAPQLKLSSSRPEETSPPLEALISQSSWRRIDFSVHLRLLSRRQPGRFFWLFARVLLKTISLVDGGFPVGLPQVAFVFVDSYPTSCRDVPFTSHLRALSEPTCRWTPSLMRSRRVPGHGPLKVGSPPGRFAVRGRMAMALVVWLHVFAVHQTLSRGPFSGGAGHNRREGRREAARLTARTQGRTSGRSFKLNVPFLRAISVQGVFLRGSVD